MKKLLLIAALVVSFTLQAQWVDDPINNTHVANSANGAAEVYVSTDISTGDSYVQWHYQGENGWSPWVQRLDVNGVPQWSANGIHVTTPDFATWSPGYSMTAVKGGMVTVFRTLGPYHWAVKINADGTFPWGEHGIVLFDGEGGGRSGVLSTRAYGPWALIWTALSCNILMPTVRYDLRPPSKTLKKNAPMVYWCLPLMVSL